MVDVSRAQTARKLAAELGAMAALAAELADEAVFELTRTRGSIREVAEALGVAEATVKKAIRLHNGRVAARASGDRS